MRYANLGHFLGLSGYYTVKMELPNAGGLFPNADVTYRGVSVGRVGTMSLTATGMALLPVLFVLVVPGALVAVPFGLAVSTSVAVAMGPGGARLSRVLIA